MVASILGQPFAATPASDPPLSQALQNCKAYFQPTTEETKATVLIRNL